MSRFRATTLNFAFLTTLAVTSLPATAKADEVFLCDGGRIVKVALEDIDWMKQNDPCVASHYGLKAHAVMVPPLPHRAPSLATTKTAKQPNSITITGRIETAAISKPATADNTDPSIAAFRMVRIINAKKGAPRFFRHRH